MNADLAALFARSTNRFTDRVAGIGDRWEAPTPCSAWSVRDLVNHLTSEQLWAPHLVGGETVASVGDRYEGDVLGADPAGAWDAAVAASVPAFSGADLDAVVHLSYGDVPGREYLTQMLTDAEVHGWDLARATGQDEALDPEVASLLWGVWSGRSDEVRGAGVFGEPVDVGEGASDGDRLLGLLGRRP